jgi:hypothetical protein
MYSLRVTAQDGSVRTHALDEPQVTIGRDRSNRLVVDGHGVSSQHCVVEVRPDGVVLHDRGSTNGTWMGNRKVEGSVRLSPGDRFYVGPVLFELEHVAAAPLVDVSEPMHSGAGPIVRGSGPHRRWRDQQAKFERYAQQWDAADRPARLLLRGDELRQAKRWLLSPPPTPADEPGRLVRELVATSAQAASRRGVMAIVLGIGGVVLVGGAAVAAWMFWPEPDPEPAVATTAPSGSTGEADGDDDDDGDVVTPQPSRPSTPDRDDDESFGEPIDHVVIPGESLADIAKRYGVDEDDLVSWNTLNPDAPLEPIACDPPKEGRPTEVAAKPATGQVLTIRKPRLRPLPQTCIEYEVEPGEGWPQIATRFGAEITRLRSYNPGVTDPKPGQKLIVWIDPKPYKPREPRQAIAELTPKDTARSIGKPDNGRLENGIQLPDNDAYHRKAPNIMYGSAYLIKNLHKAIVTFRQDVDYDGELIVADISRQPGGKFDPHKSHQAGRDVDIWLPTLKGVYKTKFLGSGKQKERRPFWYEVDWYATWGLMRALIKTDSVEAIFLDIILQPYVYNAAKNMGATEEELAKWIQYKPKGKNFGAIVTHSADHYSHIHVRFKCAPWESECKGDKGAAGD